MDVEAATTKSEEDMKTGLIEDVEELGLQHGRADYILGKVHAYLKKSPPTDFDGITFFNWFMRQYQKYQKGDK